MKATIIMVSAAFAALQLSVTAQVPNNLPQGRSFTNTATTPTAQRPIGQGQPNSATAPAVLPLTNNVRPFSNSVPNFGNGSPGYTNRGAMTNIPPGSSNYFRPTTGMSNGTAGFNPGNPNGTVNPGLNPRTVNPGTFNPGGQNIPQNGNTPQNTPVSPNAPQNGNVQPNQNQNVNPNGNGTINPNRNMPQNGTGPAQTAPANPNVPSQNPPAQPVQPARPATPR